MIKDGQIKKDIQKFCFVCEEKKKRKVPIHLCEITKKVVNSCVECFDLQIDEVWQKFTHEQRGNLRKAFLSGSLYVNGEAMLECPSCVKIKSFARERTENVYNDSYKPFNGR